MFLKYDPKLNFSYISPFSLPWDESHSLQLLHPNPNKQNLELGTKKYHSWVPVHNQTNRSTSNGCHAILAWNVVFTGYAGVSFTQYIVHLNLFSETQYIQGYVNVKKYTLIILLDWKTYPY
jgi:hypothetical protein